MKTREHFFFLKNTIITQNNSTWIIVAVKNRIVYQYFSLNIEEAIFNNKIYMRYNLISSECTTKV